MKGILELIKLLFGPKALSKTLGTRTNVIRLPNNKTKRYIKEDLNIEAASDELAQKAYNDMQKLVAELPRMNDAERLIFEGNLRRLANKLGKTEQPSAEVITFGTKEKVSPEGIKSLMQQKGQKAPPGTLMGNIESRIKQLEASGEDLSKMKGQTLDEILGDVATSQQGMKQLQREGLVRATARDIITSDIKSGKLKLPKELEQQILEGGGEPIDILRNVYGEDALEVLDSLTPEFSKLRTSTEAEKLARSKFTFEPDVNRPKGSMSLEEAAKAEQENILTPGKTIPADSPEGKKITEALIGKPKAEVVSLPTAEKILSDMRKLGPIEAMKEANKVLKREGSYKNLSDDTIKKIMDDINDHIFGGDLPVDPEDFATGGRVGYKKGTPPKEIEKEKTTYDKIGDVVTKYSGIDSMIKLYEYLDKLGAPKYTYDPFGPTKEFQRPTRKPIELDMRKNNSQGGSQGLDYLTGIERRGYADGTDLETPVYRILADGTRGPRVITDAMVKSVFGDSSYDGEDLKRVFGDNITFMSQEGYDKEKALNQQQTPTEDFSDYLNGLTPNWSPGDPAPEGYEVVSGNGDTWIQPIAPEDALTPEVPSVSPLQQHFDQNQMLKDAVAAGTITPEEYNILGGYDVQQTMAAGNPVLGGVGNLIGSTAYNIAQSIKGDQPFSDIPGDVVRNVQGGLGMISPELKQTYQDIINQRLPYMQQDQQNYQQRIAQVDPNALYNQYQQNLQSTAPTDVSQFQNTLQSNLTIPDNLATGGRVGYMGGGMSQGLDYLMGITRQGYATGSTNPFYSTYGGIPINMNILPSSANNPFYSGLLGNPLLASTDEEEEDVMNAINEFKGVQSSYGGGDGGSSYGGGDTGDGGSSAGGGDAGTGPAGCDAGSDTGTGPGGCDAGSSGGGDAGTGPGGCSTGSDAGTGPGGCSTGSDGGGGGGGKIICTAMNQAYGFGSFRQAIWLEHSKNLDPAYQVGYHAIFKPAIKYMYSSSTRRKPLAKVIRWCCEGIARRRTADIWLQKRGKGRHLIGAVERAILEPICYIVGKIKMKLKK